MLLKLMLLFEPELGEDPRDYAVDQRPDSRF